MPQATQSKKITSIYLSRLFQLNQILNTLSRNKPHSPQASDKEQLSFSQTKLQSHCHICHVCCIYLVKKMPQLMCQMQDALWGKDLCGC